LRWASAYFNGSEETMRKLSNGPCKIEPPTLIEGGPV